MAAIRRGSPQAKNQGAYRKALVSAAADGCRPVVPARRKAQVESRTRCNARLERSRLTLPSSGQTTTGRSCSPGPRQCGRCSPLMSSVSHAVVQYQFEAQRRPASALLDTQFADAVPSDKLPYVAWFGVYGKRPPGGSWWRCSEQPKLDAVEADLIRLCGGFGNGWAGYVRRLRRR
jgi:hypothetical protein